MRPDPRDRYHNRRRAVAARRRWQLPLAGLLLLVLTIAGIAVFRRPAAPAPPVVDLAPTSSPAATASRTTPAPASPAAPTTAPAAAPAAPTATAPPEAVDTFFDPQRLTYEPDFYAPEIQAFLEARSSPLATVRFQVGDRSQSFAEVVVGLSNLYSINPRVFLALLEHQSGLVTTSRPSSEQVAWAMGFRGEGGNRRGLYSQLRWASRTLRHAVRDYALAVQSGSNPPPLVFADGERLTVTTDMSLSRYVLARAIAPTSVPTALDREFSAFLETYIYLFDDPRRPPADWPPIAAPFLTAPMAERARVTSFFDHDAPFLQQNGSLTSFWGQTEVALSYDGHTGWDYGMRPPDVVLSAAPGVVVFAGNSDDGCATPARAVIIDHGNGYRTLYWHLHSIAVSAGEEVGRSVPIGVAGETGCAFGPHLHFQVQYLGRDVDPYGWCGATPDPWTTSPAGQVSVWLWQDRPGPCDAAPPGIIVVDDGAPGFERSGDWQVIAPGYGGGALFAASLPGAAAREPGDRLAPLSSPAVAVWQPDLSSPGMYRVLVYVPYLLNGLDDSRAVRYIVRHSDGTSEVVINGEDYANSWVDLGVYTFAAGTTPQVMVTTLAGDAGRGIWADAVAFVPLKP